VYKIERTRRADKGYDIAVKNGYESKLDKIAEVIERDPYEPTPGHRFEELKGDLKGIYSRRLNLSNRFTYEILPNAEQLRHPETGELYEGIIRVLTIWRHTY
jgi:Txe/YoeB family toxin of Txe-Axe toxin-antitoxin module